MLMLIIHCVGSKTNCVFTWGLGKGGALGHGDEDDKERPTIVHALNGLKVHAVVASGAHTFALAGKNNIYFIIPPNQRKIIIQ